MSEQTQFIVDQQEREFVLILPKTAWDSPIPVFFAFHGLGGNMWSSGKMFRVHEFWPEAIVGEQWGHTQTHFWRDAK